MSTTIPRQRPGVVKPLLASTAGVALALGAVTPGLTAANAADEKTIAEIQGTGAASPLPAGTEVTTKGVVTADYSSGGFNGFYIQTEGTGGAIDFNTHTASDAIFVFGKAAADLVQLGDYVEVTGKVAEYKAASAKKPGTLTQLTIAAGDAPTAVVKLNDPFTAPTPATVAFPGNEEHRESLEGMLLAPQGDYTVTDSYSTNVYGTVGLATGDKPLIIPTEIARPGSAEYAAAVADNEARSVVLDDGASTNYSNASATGTPLPYLSKTDPVRVGAGVTFTAPVVLDYRYDVWGFQPVEAITGASPANKVPATFENDRAAAPAAVGGDLKLATFNVLNYFTTTGDAYESCVFYTDRDKNPITVKEGCNARGAANAANLKRQEDKLVSAINTLDADVVSLMEIENSVKQGKDRDDALSTLVNALNADAGAGTWSFVPSPAASALPPVEAQDVIRTAFIYRTAKAQPMGSSAVSLDPAFDSARQPLAQAFKEKGAGNSTKFIVIANHFKSRRSAPENDPTDIDMGDGQGASNKARKAQATALVAFADAQKQAQATDRVFLVGDFNAYTKEDPLKVLEDAGYVNQGAKTDKYSYSYQSQSGSLDHIFASAKADASVTGADVWNINSAESIALEYSRYNYNVTDFYDTSAFRSSDHDPAIVGIASDPGSMVKLNLLNINDFHGRIAKDTTVQFAGTIEQLRAQEGDDNTLFLSDGDNIGASLFASAVQKDQPTIDVLNALDLRASAVGNHEFDGGFNDLVNRVIGPDDNRNAKWDYLGANVYLKGTQTPALKEYSIQDVEGVKVAIIGAVTEETPTLVSPGGIANLDFGDPVDAINRVAEQLTDGNAANGEADVLIAEYHEGASAGVKEGSTLEEELAHGGVFAKLVNQTDKKVAAIFTGHTHKEYAWTAAITGEDGTRSVLQTGNYGDNVGQVLLTLNRETGETLSYTSRNVARTKTAPAELVAAYPRVAAVNTIVNDALALAEVEGSKVVGSASAPVTTAHTGGSYGDDGYGGPAVKRDDRANQSTMNSLVADSLVESLKDPLRGGAEIGIHNPGGLRAEFDAGDITYAEANAVLPFANNLWSSTITGAVLKEILEQQWQTDAQGQVPSRPFLALGVSKNVRYTFDSTRALGDRITGIWVNDIRVTDAKTFRVAAPSFLLEGGDNFRAFKKGTDAKDSGLIDRDAWMDYLTAHQNLAPDFAKRGVEVRNAPSKAVVQGTKLNFIVGDTVDAPNALTNGGLDLTSLGSKKNTSLQARFVGSKSPAVTVPVTDGRAAVSITVPTDVVGHATLQLVAAGSNTTVNLAVGVTKAPVPPKVNKTATASIKVKALKKYKLSVAVSLKGATGVRPASQNAKVTIQVKGKKKTFTVKLKYGKGVLKFSKYRKYFKPGKRATITVTVPQSKVQNATTIYTVKKAVKRVKLRLK